ncbi:MAG: dihydrofolate reductase [Chitinophagaceae bacterium]|jgi:dihydrofolate reductase
MILSVVVAASIENAIGKDNQLLWKLPNDLKFFKNLTWGMPILMGRKTFESIGSKALPGRMNIVLTRQSTLIQGSQLLVAAESMEHAMALAEKSGYKELFVIGGSELYRQIIPEADNIYLTRVDGKFPDADTYIDAIDQTKFQLVSTEEMPKDEKHPYAYRFETWQRKKL